MKKWVIALFVVGAILLAVSAAKKEESDEIVRISEAFGHQIGSHLETPMIALDVDAVVRGVRSGAKGEQSPMSPEEYDEAIAAIQEQVQVALSKENLQQAEEFLASNSKVEGIVELVPQKLQYITRAEGAGGVVEEKSTPLLRFSGRFVDGTPFSASENDPIAFYLPETLEGFRKGVAGMKVGEQRTLYIHPDLAYGEEGVLPPNSLLIFDVEVVSLEAESGDRSS